MSSKAEQIQQLKETWNSERFKGITRPYTAEDVVRLRGKVLVEHTLAKRGSELLWKQLHEEDYIHSLGALTGNQAVQQVKAGLKAIMSAAGKLQLMPTWPDKCIRIKAYIRQTVFQML